jgi:hypothetical protein
VLAEIVAPHTGGDPMSAHKWLNCRLRDLQRQLHAKYPVSLPVIGRLLRSQGYRLRANRKDLEGPQKHERDQQFRHIREQRAVHQAKGQPCISVDTKKKELVGNFKNDGTIWCQEAEAVEVHDFRSQSVGRAVPYGVYDLQHNCGTIYVGQSADTPTFAVDNLVQWCQTELPQRYPGATQLFIEADAGGSNGYRSHVWKRDLQVKIADAFGLEVTVCHYPTGTSKWNPVEHRLFSEVSKTWAGCPLRSFDLILDYIEQTTTQTGLTVSAHLVHQTYELGVKVPEAEKEALALTRHTVCPQWSYTLSPRSPASAA